MSGWLLVDVPLAVVFAAFAFYLIGTPFQRVSRARLEKFGSRQLLPITIGNAPIVLRYLATTRRWRGSGIGISVALVGAWYAMTGHGGTISMTAAFAGWFVGAIIAEWRVSLPADGSARVASLQPRRVPDYLGPIACGLTGGVWVAFVCSDLVAIGYAVVLRHGLLLPVAGWTVIAAAATAALVLVVRRVLDRPQPATRRDVQDADDALRSRSLHVLAGSALAIAGFVGSALMGTLGDSVGWMHDSGSPTFAILRLVGGAFLPILGTQMASWPFRARRAVVRPTAVGA